MKAITIIGGGLAGLTAGILLRRAEVPVRVVEAGNYPRHRVCGEFLSGRGRAILRELELERKFFDRGAVEARRAAFLVEGCAPLEVELPEAAICLSRFAMDQSLAEEFQKLGGELDVGKRWGGEMEEGLVRATGRRRAETGRGHLVGLKAHALGVNGVTDLEMYFAKDRYVGICPLGGDRVSVCGLFYSREPLGLSWKELLEVPRLKGARWNEESFCAVAGITLDWGRDASCFEIGDAAAMIPPLTGNGMSMAFESARMAASILEDYSRGGRSWEAAVAEYGKRWDEEFGSRLKWANVAQRLGFSEVAQKTFSKAAPLWPWLMRAFTAHTR